MAPITLSPNPTDGVLMVRGLPSGNVTIVVVDLLGESIMEQKNVHGPEQSLDLSKLTPGAYYVRISSAQSVVTKKLIKN